MSGVAFLIEGADFSQNNLGKVNFSLPPEQQAENIVNNFEIVIGTSTYHNQLYSMVLSLIQQGLWDKINHLYPVIGNTKEQFAINIKDVDNNKWYIGNNVEELGDNYIFFNQSDAGLVDFEQYKLPIHFQNFCSFASARTFQIATHTKQVIGCFRDGNAVLREGGTGFANVSGNLVLNNGLIRFSVTASGANSPLATVVEPNVVMGDRYNFIANLNEEEISAWVNTGKTSGIPSSTTSPYLMAHGAGSLGANGDSPNHYNFHGEIHLFGHGESLSDEEIIALNSIIDEFVTAKI